MKKKSLIVITVVTIITFLILNLYQEFKNDSINIGNFIIREKLNENIIESYLSAEGEEKRHIEDEIKKMVIKDMKLDEWKNDLEYINVIVTQKDIIDDNKSELLVGLNLSKNLAIIGIYSLESGSYSLRDKITNLTNIEKIDVIIDEKSDEKFLVLEEFLDERVGAYFTDKFVRIFTKIDDEFEEVFRQSLDYEAYYYEKWLDVDAENPKWVKLNEKSVTEYDSKLDKSISIMVSKKIKKYEGVGGSTNNIPSEFKQVEEKDFVIDYFWSMDYKRFIIGKGEVISTGEKVAVLEDTGKSVDYLLNLGDKYYKVINKNMKVKYIKENELKLDDL